MTPSSGPVAPQRAATAFIAENLPLVPAPSRPDILLHLASRGSRLGSLLDSLQDADARQPYWAFHWAGGLALAQYLQEHPECVAGKRVLDYGAGSGIVAIAAAKAGARAVTAADADANAGAAIALNAAANGVRIDVLVGDVASVSLPAAEVVLAGDVFYDPEPAAAAEAVLDRCIAAGMHVLVGDPGRRHLPLHRLRALAEYPVADFGMSTLVASATGAVYAYECLEAGRNHHHFPVRNGPSAGLEPANDGD